MKHILTILLLTALTAHADQVTRVYVNLTGTNEYVSVQRDSSLNPATPLAANEVARKEYSYATPRDFVGVITNEFDEIENVYTPVASKYWVWDGNDIVAMDQADRDARDSREDAEWVAANTKSSKQLVAEGRLVTIVTSAFPAVTFPLSSQTQIDSVADQILVKVNQQRLLYGTQTGTLAIGSFIANNEALSDVQAIRDYIRDTFGGSVSDSHFGRQVNTGDAP